MRSPARVRGEELYQEQDENVFEVPGNMSLNDFNNLTNFGLEDPRMTTIAGLAFRHLDRLPREGDKVDVEGLTITVLSMDSHRIARVRVAPAEGEDEDEVSAEALEAGQKSDGVRASDGEVRGPAQEHLDESVTPADQSGDLDPDPVAQGQRVVEESPPPIPITGKKRPKRR